MQHQVNVSATEPLRLMGTLRIFINKKGEDTWEPFWEGHNLITYAGMNKLLATLVNVANTSYFGYIAVSTSTAATSASNTTLPGEVFRKAIDSATANTSTRSVTLQTTLNFTDASGNALTKYGHLSAAVAGTLLNETNHTLINKTTSIQVMYQYTLAMV